MMQPQLESAQRTGERALMLFIDVDGLKGINDTYGHDEGDCALKLAAEALKSTFRGSDIVARFGGDEFVAFLPGCPGDFADRILDRLETKTRALSADSQKPYRLSLCVGAVEFDPAVPASLDEMIKEADRRMYGARRMRRQSQSQVRVGSF